jgi:large subunit ribosomal protein L22
VENVGKKQSAMEAVCKLRNIPMSPRKMRLVVDNIRGKGVDEALNILRYTNKEAAMWLEKALVSAVANWEQKGEGESADNYDLIVKTAFVDEGSMLKRVRPAPHGRAHRIRKRTNHVTIVVSNLKPLDNELVDMETIDGVEGTSAVEE